MPTHPPTGAKSKQKTSKLLSQQELNDGLKVATLNLCMGIPNKKNIMKQINTDKNIYVLLMQEMNVEINFFHELLRIQL
jgi:hypothetical protein